MNFQLPADIHHAAWQKITPGLTRILSRCGLDNSELNKIQQAVEVGEAHLFMVRDGFCVLKPKKDSVFVWIAACDSGNALEKYLPEIDYLASLIGARYLEWRSPRPGWRKLAGRHGWTVTDSEDGFTIFRRSVQHEQIRRSGRKDPGTN